MPLCAHSIADTSEIAPELANGRNPAAIPALGPCRPFECPALGHFLCQGAIVSVRKIVLVKLAQMDLAGLVFYAKCILEGNKCAQLVREHADISIHETTSHIMSANGRTHSRSRSSSVVMYMSAESVSEWPRTAAMGSIGTPFFTMVDAALCRSICVPHMCRPLKSRLVQNPALSSGYDVSDTQESVGLE